MVTRRYMLASTIGAVTAWAADFWNAKDPSAWSPEDIHLILNKSPWAKQVTVVQAIIPGRFSPSSGVGTNQGDRTGPGDTGQVTGPNRGADQGKQAMTGIMPGEPHKGMVRWESAKPVLAANPRELPGDFEGHYVIGVGGFPMGEVVSADGTPKLSERELERITGASFLTTRGKRPAPATLSRMAGAAVWIGFARFPLTVDEKEVAFATKLGGLDIHTKFSLKEMMYQGTLAI